MPRALRRGHRAIVFGWVFAAHQVGAAIAAFGAGAIRDSTGSYGGAFWTAALLCLVAAGLSFAIRPTSDRVAVSAT